jgi:hypothetical protein
MSIDREAIWVKLYQVIKTSLGSSVVTCGRKHVMPPDLSVAQQPAVFVIQKQESKDPRPRGLTGKLTLHGFIWIYVYESAANEVPGQETHLAATDLNALIKAIDDALAPDTTDGACTLGGLVSHCWVEGETDQDPGIFGQQAMALIPVHILVP